MKLSSTSIRDEFGVKLRLGDTSGGYIKEGDNIGPGASDQDRRFTLEIFKILPPMPKRA